MALAIGAVEGVPTGVIVLVAACLAAAALAALLPVRTSRGAAA
jgi:hypothetical protein